MWFITLLVLIFILGLLVLIHEFGHFIFAKKAEYIFMNFQSVWVQLF